MLPPRIRFVGHRKPPLMVLVADRTARVISTSDERLIKIWDMGSGRHITVIDDMDPGVHSPIMVAAISPDGLFLATGAADFTTKVYAIHTGQRLNRISAILKSKYNSADYLSFTADGSILLAVTGAKVELIGCQTWSCQKVLKHKSKITSVCSSPDSRQIATTAGKNAVLWKCKNSDGLVSLSGHTKTAHCSDFSPDGRMLATGGADHAVILWDTNTGSVLEVYKEHSGTVFNVLFSADGASLISAHLCVNGDWQAGPTSEIHIWDTRTLRCRFKCSVDGTISSLTISSDGRWLSCSACHTTIIDICNGLVIHTVPDSEASAFLADCSGIVTSDGNDLVLWDLPPKHGERRG